jgi:hypothetical protein
MKLYAGLVEEPAESELQSRKESACIGLFPEDVLGIFMGKGMLLIQSQSLWSPTATEVVLPQNAHRNT